MCTCVSSERKDFIYFARGFIYFCNIYIYIIVVLGPHYIADALVFFNPNSTIFRF